MIKLRTQKATATAKAAADNARKKFLDIVFKISRLSINVTLPQLRVTPESVCLSHAVMK